MAYSEQTTVNSHKHVIDLLETFLGAQGWTIDNSVNAAERELYISKANGGETFYFSVKSTGSNSLVIQGHTAYPSAGSSGSVFMNLKSTSMVRCWFFAGDLYAWVVVEVANGYIQIGGFGRLSPYDGFAASSLDGAFVVGNNNTAWSTLTTNAGSGNFYLFENVSSPPAMVRHVPSAGVQWGVPAPAIVGPQSGSFSQWVRESVTLMRLPNTNGDRPMLPVRVIVPHNPAPPAGYQTHYSPGFYPGIRMMAGHQVANASEQTIGSDVWKRFSAPHQNIAIQALSFFPNSSLFFAFLK